MRRERSERRIVTFHLKHRVCIGGELGFALLAERPPVVGAGTVLAELLGGLEKAGPGVAVAQEGRGVLVALRGGRRGEKEGGEREDGSGKVGVCGKSDRTRGV